jgi:hypothetical protein
MNDSKQETKTPRKAYQSPTLRIYGDLREITLSGMPGAHVDSRGVGFGADRTT